MRPGEIELERASRAFDIRGDRGRTFKELLLRREHAAGPPPVQALDEVTLRIEPGETVGIVGRNGAGKSSTLRVLAGIVPLDSGQAQCGGRVVTLLELGAGFGRDFDGRENILLNGALHGMARAEIEARMDEIVAFSELGEFIDVPVKTYSSGMFVRLGFAIAAHLAADVMLIDEVLAVGDEAFQRKCETRIAERVDEGATLVLVSHDAALIERTCDRVVVLDAGAVRFDGAAADGLAHYHEMMGTVTA
jgi:ABC-type polysaccharide/polyol phosphate transport system ATPase subunit